MLKAEKIYAGFYSCGRFSIQRKWNDNWYICDEKNKILSVKWTLKDAVDYCNRISVQ